MSSPLPPRPVRRPTLWKRLARLARNVFLALLLVAVLVLVFQGPILRRFVVPRIAVELERVLGLKASIDGVRINPWGSISVGRVDLSGDAPLSGVLGAGFESAELRFSLWRLVRGQTGWLRKVTLLRPRLVLHLERDPILPRGGDGSAGSSGPAQLELPRIEVIDADLQFLSNVDAIRLRGVDVSVVGRRVRFIARSGEGNWKPPRVAALKFPLEVDVALAGESEPWRLIHVDRLAMAGRDYTNDFRVEILEGGIVKLSGPLPGWGVTLTQGSLEDNLLDLRFRGEGGDLRSIVALFTDWPVPEARATGDFRLILPLKDERSWRVETDMELRDVSWPEESFRADAVHAVVRRGGPGLVLEGDVHAVRAGWREVPPLDLVGRFRRWDPGEAQGGPRVAIDDATLFPQGEPVDVSGLLGEEDFTWESGAMRASAFPLAALESLGVLPAGLGPLGGAANIEACFKGSSLDPASLFGVARLSAAGDLLRGETVPWSLDLSAEVAACMLRIDDGLLRRGDDEARFALTVNTDAALMPVAVALDRLQGTVGGAEFNAIEPPLVDLDGDEFVLHPTTLLLLGGTVSAHAAVDFEGRGFASLEGSGLDLANLDLALPGSAELRTLAPVGAVSFRAELSSLQGASQLLPALALTARVQGGALNLNDRQIDGLDMSLQLDVTSDELQLRELKLSRGASSVKISGSVPIVWRPFPLPSEGSAFDATFQADLPDGAALFQLPQDVRELGGHVVAEGSVRGLSGREPRGWLDSLEISALVSVLDGRVKAGGDFPPFSDVRAEVRLAGRTLTIDSLSGKVHDSSFTLTGDAEVSFPWDLEGASVRTSDLRFISKSVLLIRRPELRVRGDVDLRWSGSGDAPHLEGSVNIERAYYLEDVSLAPSRGARLPLKLFSLKTPPLDGLALGVRIRSNRGITIKNNIVSTRATADLFLGGTGLEPILTGTLSTDEGFVRFADSTLQLRSSFVEFRLDDPLNPRLQIHIGQTIRGYAVTLSITGTLEAPEVLLDSSPPLEREKVLVLIATGLTLDEIEERGVSRVAAVKAAKYVGIRLARYFSRGDPTDRSFIDRFSLETESARSARQEDPIRVEYRLIERLIRENDELFLQGERDNWGDYNFNVGVRFELD